jgi:anti-sigma B factor antagonist
VTTGEQLRVEVHRSADHVVLALNGELDLASAQLLQREVESAEIAAAPRLVLDLEGLDFIDSSGLRVLLSAYERARERGQEFAVTRGSPQVQRLLAITRVGERLGIVAPSSEVRLDGPAAARATPSRT